MYRCQTHICPEDNAKGFPKIWIELRTIIWKQNTRYSLISKHLVKSNMFKIWCSRSFVVEFTMSTSWWISWRTEEYSSITSEYKSWLSLMRLLNMTTKRDDVSDELSTIHPVTTGWQSQYHRINLKVLRTQLSPCHDSTLLSIPLETISHSVWNLKTKRWTISL